MENIFPKKVGNPVSKYDEHWRPMFLLCPPCHFKSDVFVKIETFDRYPDYFLSTSMVFQVNWSTRLCIFRDTEFITSQRNLENEVSLRKKHSSKQSQDSQVKEYGGKKLAELVLRYSQPKFAFETTYYCKISRCLTFLCF